MDTVLFSQILIPSHNYNGRERFLRVSRAQMKAGQIQNGPW